MTRPISITVNSFALASNLLNIKKFAPKSKVWSVIKANGYGHGLSSVLKGFRETDGFALLDIEEGIQLRNNGWKGPILLLEGFFKKEDLYLVDYYQFTTVVHSEWQIEMLKNVTPNFPINVYVKLNSGMNRLGFNEKKFLQVWEILKTMKQVKSLTLMTHFACAGNEESVQEQMMMVERFSKLAQSLCLANSAATIWHPDTRRQWIRPGIVLYGASPNGNWKDVSTIGLKPAMTLTSELIAIQNISHGNKNIGYGQKRLIKRDKKAGIVACGYADGYPAHASDKTPVMIKDIRTHIIGKVSMDMLMIDLSYCPKIEIGSPVELWGEKVKIDEVANASNTSSYEIFSSLSSRVPISVY